MLGRIESGKEAMSLLLLLLPLFERKEPPVMRWNRPGRVCRGSGRDDDALDPLPMDGAAGEAARFADDAPGAGEFEPVLAIISSRKVGVFSLLGGGGPCRGERAVKGAGTGRPPWTGAPDVSEDTEDC
jgi:hypothetical protein